MIICLGKSSSLCLHVPCVLLVSYCQFMQHTPHFLFFFFFGRDMRSDRISLLCKAIFFLKFLLFSTIHGDLVYKFKKKKKKKKKKKMVNFCV